MGKLTGNLGFTGRLGNISAYKTKGSDTIMLRTKGGPSRDKVKHHPAFEGTRRNNDEFGGASTAVKAIRNALYPVRHISGGSVGHINKFTRALANLDTVNPWGKRAVRFSETRQLLEGFNLNQKLPLSSIIRQPLTGTISRNTGSAGLVIPALLPRINLQVPPEYKLYRFVVMLTVIPDFEYFSPVEPKYRPVAPVTYPVKVYTTAWFAAKQQLPEQHFNLQLENFTGLQDCHSLVLALGIEFGLPLSTQLVETIAKKGAAQILVTG